MKPVCLIVENKNDFIPFIIPDFNYYIVENEKDVPEDSKYIIKKYPVNLDIKAICKRLHDEDIGYIKEENLNAYIKGNECQDLSDTTLVWAFFGNSPIRIQAAHKSLLKIKEIQNKLPNLLIVEIVYDNKYPMKRLCNIFEKCKYFPIYGNENNKDLFQKESIYNIILPYIDTKYVIFADADIWSEDKFWLEKCVKILRKSPDNTLIQCLRRIDDTKDERFGRFGVVWDYLNNEGQLHPNPGLIWAANTEFIQKYKFNPWFYSGGGDDALVIEFVNKNLIQYLYNLNGFKSVLRDNLPKTIFKAIDSNVNHEFHGSYNERNYYWTRTISQYITMDVRSFIKIGDNGLLEWLKKDNALRRCVYRCKDLKGIKDIDMIIKEEFPEYGTFLQ